MLTTSGLALSGMWSAKSDNGAALVPLRDHVIHLSAVAAEMAAVGEPWDGVAENLLYAASLRDVMADTDIHDTAPYCESAMDYESVHSALTEKFLAGVIIFNLVWNAYESGVEVVGKAIGGKRPKGALGSDLLLSAKRRLPYLRDVTMRALELSDPRSNGDRGFLRFVRRHSIEGIAGESLRQFRNSVIHGDFPKPRPSDQNMEDLGWSSRGDKFLPLFQSNVRLSLMLTQQFMLDFVSPEFEITWRSEDLPAVLVLTQLHCVQTDDDEQLSLPLKAELLSDYGRD